MLHFTLLDLRVNLILILFVLGLEMEEMGFLGLEGFFTMGEVLDRGL